MRISKRSNKYPARKPIPGKRVSSLEKDLSVFLGVLCVEWGFCISPEDAVKISSYETLTANEFAKLVLEAEGMDISTSPWFKKISKRFSIRFGNSVCRSTYNSD